METAIPASVTIPARVAFALWVPAVLITCAYLLASHTVTLPAPASVDPQLGRAIEASRGTVGMGRWMAMHVLSAECGCSRRVLRHLVDRGPRAGVYEQIVMVGHDDSASTTARSRGFGFTEVTPDQLASHYHIEIAPLLVIADPAGSVRYLGGYTERKQGADIRDVSILAAVADGQSVHALPTFGCAVSRALRDRVDPLGIR